MKIKVNVDRPLFEIQEEFNNLFPYLKLEFVVKPNTLAEKRNGKNGVANSAKTLKDYSVFHQNKTITIVPEMTVADLEQSFKNVYGLIIQVLRKSGKAWLGTTITDGWTLYEQNKQGQALSLV
jgi:hypothetical protein